MIINSNSIDGNRIGHKLNRGRGYWVSQNEDGTLTVSLDGKEKYQNAGSLIGSLGGIEKTLEACEPEEITLEAFRRQMEEEARIARYGREPSDEQKQKNRAFYEHLVELQERLRKPHQNERGLWISAKLIGREHKPVHGNEGFRFEYPFNDIRFDSVYGWQQHGKYVGWTHTTEIFQKVIELRIHFGLPKYEPKPDEEERYNTNYEHLMERLSRNEHRNAEITAAYDAIKDLRPVPATIDNLITLICS